MGGASAAGTHPVQTGSGSSRGTTHKSLCQESLICETLPSDLSSGSIERVFDFNSVAKLTV